MRKMIVALVSAMLLGLLLQPAVLAASDSIEIEIGGRQLTLAFDPSQQFSNVTGGTVQASFYTYLDGSKDLYELYLIFPQDVHPGTVIDPEYARKYAPNTSVVLIVTTQADANYYFAGQAENTDATDYTIAFDGVEDTAAGRTYSGTLSASLIGMSTDFETEIPPISIDGARFSFTMPANAEAPGETTPPEDADPFGSDEENPFDVPVPAPTRETYRI